MYGKLLRESHKYKTALFIEREKARETWRIK